MHSPGKPQGDFLSIALSSVGQAVFGQVLEDSRARVIDPSPDSPITPSESARETAPAELPLYVDLDGTLIQSDMLWESIARLLHEQPLTLLRLPGWLLAGKAAFKTRVAERTRPCLLYTSPSPRDS